jgi:hypothetical protein
MGRMPPAHAGGRIRGGASWEQALDWLAKYLAPPRKTATR